MKISLARVGIVIGIAGAVGLVFSIVNTLPDSASLTADVSSIIEEPSEQIEEPSEQTVPPVQPQQDPITVTVSPSSTSAGESIVVTVAPVNDTPIFWLMDIYLESSTGLTSVKGSIINIDGEGRRFGDITIPQDAEPGIWKVKTVEITDTEGTITSYSFGTDIFSTFTVVTP